MGAFVAYFYLRVPFEIGVHDDHLIEFRSLFRRTRLAPSEIVSVKARRCALGYIDVLHARGTVHLVSQMDGAGQVVFSESDLTVCLSAHPIGQDEEVEGGHQAVAVLVVIAHAPDVGARADVKAHRKTPTSSVAWRARLAREEHIPQMCARRAESRKIPPFARLTKQSLRFKGSGSK